MLLAADPALMLLDEPAAGLSKNEIERNGRAHSRYAHQTIGGCCRARHGVRSDDWWFSHGFSSRRADPGRGLRWRISGATGRCATCTSASALMPMLEVDELTASYGRIPVLNGISFAVAAGEVLGILGYNGMGKTTLMKSLIGLVPSSGGTIRFER